MTDPSSASRLAVDSPPADREGAPGGEAASRAEAQAGARVDQAAHQARRRELSTLVRKGATWAMAMLIARQVVGIGVTAVTARLLAPADFGVMAMVMVYFQFLSLVDLGLKWTTVQADSLDASEVTDLFWWGALGGLALWGLAAAGGPLLAAFFHDPRLPGLSILVGSCLFLNSLATQPLALLKRRLHIRSASIVETAALVVGGVAAVATAWRGWGYWALAVQVFVAYGTRVVLAWSATGFRPGVPRLRRLARGSALLQLSGWLGVSNWISYVQLYLDSILVGRLHGAGELGLYSRVTYIRSLPTTYTVTAMNDVAIPALSRIKDDGPAFARAYRDALKTVCLVTLPLAVAIWFASDEIVLVLFGPQWTAVSAMLQWQALAIVMLPVFHTGAWLFIALGKGRAQVLANLVLTAVLAGAYVLAVGGGAYRMSVVTGITSATILPFGYLWAAHRAAGLSLVETLKPLVPLVAALALAWLAALVLSRAVPAGLPHLRPWVGVAVAGFVYGAAVWWRGDLAWVLRRVR